MIFKIVASTTLIESRIQGCFVQGKYKLKRNSYSIMDTIFSSSSENIATKSCLKLLFRGLHVHIDNEYANVVTRITLTGYRPMFIPD